LRIKHTYLEDRIKKTNEMQGIRNSYDTMILESWREIINALKQEGRNTDDLEKK